MTIELVQLMQLGGFIVTLIVAILGLYKYFSSRIDEVRKEMDKKVCRVYERFDEYKIHTEDMLEKKFVQKNLCDVMHENNADSLTGLESRINTALGEIKTELKSINEFLLNKK